MPHAACIPPRQTAAPLPRELPPSQPALDEPEPLGCGWYASSFELCRGVEVREWHPSGSVAAAVAAGR